MGHMTNKAALFYVRYISQQMLVWPLLGAPVDDPEGSRYAQVSETMLRDISFKLAEAYKALK